MTSYEYVFKLNGSKETGGQEVALAAEPCPGDIVRMSAVWVGFPGDIVIFCEIVFVERSSR